MALPISIERLLDGHTVEGHRIEFKGGWNPAPIYRSICAFANDIANEGGGYIVIGVDEDNGLPIRPVKGIPLEQIEPLGKESFTLYTVGDADQPYSVSVQGDKCSARIGQERTLTISCPKNQRCIVTVTSGDGKYWDTVLISNRGRFHRITAQRLEMELRLFWEEIVPVSQSGQLGVQAWTWLRTKLPLK